MDVHQKQSYVSVFPVLTSNYGTHFSLMRAERIELVESLRDNLTVTQELVAQLKTIQWMLNDFSFGALRRMFERIAVTTLKHLDFLSNRIQQVGGFVVPVEMSILANPAATHRFNFAASVLNVHACTDLLSNFATLTRNARKHAAASGDYATVHLINDVLQSAQRLILEIHAHLPRDSEADIEPRFASTSPGERACRAANT